MDDLPSGGYRVRRRLLFRVGAGGALGARNPALQDLAFPWQAGVAGVAGIVAGLVAGVLGGFVPALRAARIPIATIMRA